MEVKYPHIYSYADDRSICMQKRYLRMLFLEYLLLFLTALNISFNYPWKYLLAVIIFLSLMIVVFIKNKASMAKGWYKYRALAESIKTSTWRYIMRSEPFNADSVESHKSFHEFLIGILSDSNIIPEKTRLSILKKNEYTNSMEKIRSLPLEDRREIYKKQRLIEQEEWYTSKAIKNASQAKNWKYTLWVFYALTALALIINYFYNQNFIVPVAILTTLSSAILGWSQVKRFDELSASYSLTAHEISYIVKQIDFIDDEDNFSNFIKDAELAFSREHTQWKARRS